MKMPVLFIMLLIGVAVAQAREPYGDYVCRYNSLRLTGKKHGCRDEDVGSEISRSHQTHLAQW